MEPIAAVVIVELRIPKLLPARRDGSPNDASAFIRRTLRALEIGAFNIDHTPPTVGSTKSEIGNTADKGIVDSTRESDAVKQGRRTVLAITSGEAPFQAKGIIISIELRTCRGDKMNNLEPVAILSTSIFEGRSREKHHGFLDLNDVVKLGRDDFLPIVPTAAMFA